MVYLAVFHWGWLIVSLLLGFAMGWIAVVHRGRGVAKTDCAVAVVTGLALIVAAFTHVVPGRFGYWLDLGLVMLGVYLVGCAVGSGCATGWSRVRRRPADSRPWRHS